MSGLNLAALLISVFLAGAYVALFVRALIATGARRRIDAAAREALSPDQLAVLRESIAAIDERAMLMLERDTGATTTVYFPRR